MCFAHDGNTHLAGWRRLAYHGAARDGRRAASEQITKTTPSLPPLPTPAQGKAGPPGDFVFPSGGGGDVAV